MESNIQHLFHSLKESVFHGPAETDPHLRQAIHDKLRSEVDSSFSEPLPSPILNDYVEKVARNAYKIVDQDIDKLKAEGLSEAEIFELTIAAGWAAGVARFERGISLLHSLQSVPS